MGFLLVFPCYVFQKRHPPPNSCDHFSHFSCFLVLYSIKDLSQGRDHFARLHTVIEGSSYTNSQIATITMQKLSCVINKETIMSFVLYKYHDYGNGTFHEFCLKCTNIEGVVWSFNCNNHNLNCTPRLVFFINNYYTSTWHWP